MGTISARFIRASGTNTGTPSRKQTVTICSVVVTLYMDFKNGTVLFTVELHTTDRPSPSLHCLSSASSVKEPLVSTTRSPPKAPCIRYISTDSVHLQSICPTPKETIEIRYSTGSFTINTTNISANKH